MAIELTVNKISSNPSRFILSPLGVNFGSTGSNLLDTLHINVPPEWEGKTIRITFSYSTIKGKVRITKILDNTKTMQLTSDITAQNGNIEIDAAGSDNSAAYSSGGYYIVNSHPPAGGDNQNIIPDEYHQFVSDIAEYSNSAQNSVAETKGYSDSAQVSKEAALLSEQNSKTSETNSANSAIAAAGSATAAETAKEQVQAANIVIPQSWTDDQKSTARTNINAVSPTDLTAGDWITPTLLNGWTQYDLVNYPVRYYKDSNNTVHFQGRLSGGPAGIGAFMLPLGYRLKHWASFSVPNLSASLVVTTAISNSGAVFPSAINTYNTFVDISGISFRAEA